MLIVRHVMSPLTLPCTIDAVRGRRHRFLEALLKASGVAAERISIHSKQNRGDFQCFDLCEVLDKHAGICRSMLSPCVLVRFSSALIDTFHVLSLQLLDSQQLTSRSY